MIIDFKKVKTIIDAKSSFLKKVKFMKTIAKLFIAFILLTRCYQATQASIIPLIPELEQIHAPSLVETSPGSFLVAFYGGTKVLSPDNKQVTDCKIWLSYFNQTEESWSTPVIIASSEEIVQESSIPCLDPVLCKSPTGTIYLFYKIGTSTENWTGYVKSSDDHGITWSTPRCLAELRAIGPHRCKPIFYNHDYLGESCLICPSTEASWNFRAGCVELIDKDFKRCKTSAPIQAPKNLAGMLQQPVIFHTGINLQMLFRVRNLPHIYRSTSSSGGITWRAPEPVNELAGSDSSLDAIRLTSGKFLLAYNDITGSKRYRLVFMTQLSPNTKWQLAKVIAQSDDENDVFCYPSVIQSSDSMIRLVYVKNYQEICYEVIHPDELS